MKQSFMKQSFFVGRFWVLTLVVLCAGISESFAQSVKSSEVPVAVKTALMKKYPAAKGVTWEKEKGNFEANWGGSSKEDNSVLFTPGGEFVEIVVATPVKALPAGVLDYVRRHYPAGTKITEAGKVTDAQGKLSYEAEVKGRDLIFDEKGNFLK